MREFAFKLALVMGDVDVDGMLDRIDLRLFYEWMEYYRNNSFGDELMNYWQSLTCSLLYNPNRGKGAKKLKPKDFMPTLIKKKKQTTAELGAKFRAFAQAHNAALKNK